MSILTLLVVLLVAWTVLWAASTLIGLFQVPAAVSTSLYVLVVLFVILWIAQSLGVSVPPLRVR
jgi:hypothetical protein